MANYALLDYDGFICKAFYAAAARGDMEDAPEVLKELTDSAIDRACKYFKGDIEVIKVMSGHTYKKDLYPEYKAHRKKDPYIGLFREQTLKNDESILKVDKLEADDIIVMLDDVLAVVGDNTIVFSDDKDLKYYCPVHCKLNITEEVEAKDYEQQFLMQMLTGDKEDNIKGIPKVGQKTAEKLINKDSTIKTVAKIYKEKGIDLDEAIKQVVLVSPLKLDFCFAGEWHSVFDMYTKIINQDDDFISDCIEGQLQYISKIFTEVYSEKE